MKKWKVTHGEPMRRWKATQGKPTKKMEMFLQKITDSVGTQLHGMNSTIVKTKEEDDRYKQISERITNRAKKILDKDEKKTKTEVTNPEEHMETRIKVRL